MRVPRLVPLAAVLAAACAHAPASAPDAAAAARAPAAPAPVQAPASAQPAGDEWFMSVQGGVGDLRVSVGGAGSAGVPVVFVHGLGTDLEAWRAQLDHLRAMGIRAVAYDQRGHGGSDRPADGVYTIDALVDDLARVVNALSLRRFVLVGHSMSGAVLSGYAGAHPDAVAGLVYVDAVGSFDSVPRGAVREVIAADAARDADGVRAAYVEMLGPKAREETRRRVLASAASLDPRAFASLRRSMIEAPSREAFGRWHGPAVAIETGAQPLPISASAALGVRRVVVPDVSHWVMMDAPGATNDALDAFLATVPR